MDITIEKERVREIMKSFHILTGITFVFFDMNGKTILKYPEKNILFCSCMKAGKQTGKRCMECDKEALMHCREKNGLYVYRCHAGLTEACTPLFLKGEAVGYLMLGQITDHPEKGMLGRYLRQYLEHNCLDGLEKVRQEHPEDVAHLLQEKEGFASEILSCTQETIHAATTIMNACSSFMISEKSIQKKKKAFLDEFHEYLDLHLGEELSVERICRNFGIGRTKLYEICRELFHCSIGAYIRNYRFERACKLLQEGDMTIAEITEQCGYSDLEYFCKIYKQKKGKSARKELQEIKKR